VQVLSGNGPSLRDRIIRDDRNLERFNLQVIRTKKLGRSHGWAKLRSTSDDRRGTINIEWHARSKMLICRVVTRGRNKPNSTIGDFVDYMLTHHRRRTEMISILSR
jgi:hypothetical protein